MLRDFEMELISEVPELDYCSKLICIELFICFCVCFSLQVSAIWTILLRDFEMELISEVPEPNYEDMVVGPKGPVRIRYRRKAKAAPAEAAQA